MYPEKISVCEQYLSFDIMDVSCSGEPDPSHGRTTPFIYS